MIPVLDLSIEQLAQAVAALGQPAFRAKQVADWVWTKRVGDPARMTNLPAALRGELAVLTSRVLARADSADGTVKLLIQYPDGEAVECVLIPEPRRETACLSTQTGCAMACTFCASGMAGPGRDLGGGEILQQVLHLEQAAGRRVTNAVFMGTGEPLANYRGTIEAVRALVDPQRLGMSARNVVVSTVGLPDPIRRLGREKLPITLAISLHAPNDALRRRLMPTVKASIDDILEAAGEFFESRSREVTLEYLLLAGVNDSTLCAEGLSRLARRLRCNVNLIRYNPVPGLAYKPSPAKAVEAFAGRLKSRGVNVHVRRSRGSDIAAACGQLRRQELEGQSPADSSPADAPPGPEKPDST
jgi:23S rRNA (adenine2503-C2)-methyltransferase